MTDYLLLLINVFYGIPLLLLSIIYLTMRHRLKKLTITPKTYIPYIVVDIASKKIFRTMFIPVVNIYQLYKVVNSTVSYIKSKRKKRNE